MSRPQCFPYELPQFVDECDRKTNTFETLIWATLDELIKCGSEDAFQCMCFDKICPDVRDIVDNFQAKPIGLSANGDILLQVTMEVEDLLVCRQCGEAAHFYGDSQYGCEACGVSF